MKLCLIEREIKTYSSSAHCHYRPYQYGTEGSSSASLKRNKFPKNFEHLVYLQRGLGEKILIISNIINLKVRVNLNKPFSHLYQKSLPNSISPHITSSYLNPMDTTHPRNKTMIFEIPRGFSKEYEGIFQQTSESSD